MSLLNILSLAGSAISAQSQRLNTVASNLANADTPGFKARDFDFAAALKNATGASAAGTVITSSASASSTLSSPAGSGSPRVLSTVDAGGAHLVRTQSGHLAAGHSAASLGGAAVEHSTRLQYTTPEQGSLDGNSVDLNRERANFADNSLRYEATLRFINGRVRTMITAIRGE